MITYTLGQPKPNWTRSGKGEKNTMAHPALFHHHYEVQYETFPLSRGFLTRAGIFVVW